MGKQQAQHEQQQQQHSTMTYATTAANLVASAKRGCMKGRASITAIERIQHHTVARSWCSSLAPEVRAICNGAASPSAPAPMVAYEQQQELQQLRL
jgi:hypothetical protein